MRIAVNDYLGHAPQVQLSRTLASRGHHVLHLYCADVQTPKADLRRQNTDPPGFAIEALTLKGGRARSFLGQRRREAALGRLAAKHVLEFRPDVILAANNPLDAQRTLQSACRRAAIKFVYWMHEFYSVKIDQSIEGWGAARNLVFGSYYHWLERRLLQRSDAIVPVADDFLAILSESWDVSQRQCMVVHSWAPLDRLTPGNKDNAWARELGLADRKVALYTGSLGSMEDPLLLVELAERLRQRTDVQIVVISEGAGADQVAHEASTRMLTNLRVLPFQPYEIYGDVLASADVLLAIVGGHAGVLFVPSKVNSYLCAGRPIVMAAPWQNLAAKSVAESGGSRVVPPGDADAMAAAVLAFIDDDRLCRDAGERARRYAEETFEISSIADRFERLLERLHVGPPRRRP